MVVMVVNGRATAATTQDAVVRSEARPAIRPALQRRAPCYAAWNCEDL